MSELRGAFTALKGIAIAIALRTSIHYWQDLIYVIIAIFIFAIPYIFKENEFAAQIPGKVMQVCGLSFMIKNLLTGWVGIFVLVSTICFGIIFKYANINTSFISNILMSTGSLSGLLQLVTKSPLGPIIAKFSKQNMEIKGKFAYINTGTGKMILPYNRRNTNEYFSVKDGKEINLNHPRGIPFYLTAFDLQVDKIIIRKISGEIVEEFTENSVVSC